MPHLPQARHEVTVKLLDRESIYKIENSDASKIQVL